MNQIKDERKPLSGKGGERFTREGIPGFSIEFMPKSWLFLSDKFFVPKSSMRYFLSCLRSESFLEYNWSTNSFFWRMVFRKNIFWILNPIGPDVSWDPREGGPSFLPYPPINQGLLYTRTEDSGPFFSKSEAEKISKNGSNIICTSLKNKHFLFYAQGCGAKIKPAIPFWNLNFKSP